MITLVLTQLSITNSQLSALSGELPKSDGIKVVDSSITVEDTTISNLDLNFLYLITGRFDISNTTFSSSNSSLPFLFMIHGSDGTIRNSRFDSVLSDGSQSIKLSLSDLEISNTTFSDSKRIHTSESTLLISNCTFQEQPEAIKSLKSKMTITDSNFTMLGEIEGETGLSAETQGNALSLTDSKEIRVETSRFVGSKGTPIFVSNSEDKSKQTQISNCTFEDNHSSSQGGAILYDHFPPLIEDCSFTNNSAPYGENIASYPVKMKMKVNDGDWTEDFKIEGAISGQSLNSTV